MRLSARNQLRGKIVSVQQGIVNALVTLDANGVLVSANITKASAQELGLEPGKDAIAVIKSTEVMIGLEKVRLSVRNQFAGKIASIELGAVNSIVRFIGVQSPDTPNRSIKSIYVSPQLRLSAFVVLNFSLS